MSPIRPLLNDGPALFLDIPSGVNQLKTKPTPPKASLLPPDLAGVLFALGTAFFFGVSTPLAKLFVSDVQPWMLAGLLYLGGGLGLLPIYLFRILTGASTHSIQREDLRALLSSMLAGGIAAPVLLMTGLTQTSASVAALLLNFESVFTAIVAWTFFREPWHWRVLMGIVIITTGGVLISHTESSNLSWSWGAVALLGTCLAWAIDSNFSAKIAHRDPVQVALLKSGGAGATNVVIAAMAGQSFPSVPIFLKVCSAGFVGYGLTYCCFILALRHLGVSRTGAFFALSPLVGVAIAILLLGEPLTSAVVMAAILMAIGATLCSGK